MKRLALLTIALFSSYVSVSAQTGKKPEFFAGYSYESVDTGIKSTDFISTTTGFDNRFKLNGFRFSAADYFSKRFGIAVDFSAQFDTRTDSFGTTTGQTEFSLYNITGGPQIRFPNTSRFTPFAQALTGVARRNFTETIAGTATSYVDNKTSFTMNLGGGVDYRINKRFAWRIAQFGYNPIFLQSRTVNSIAFPDRTLNGFRFSTGIVFK